MCPKVGRDYLLDKRFQTQVVICYTFGFMDTLHQRHTHTHRFVLAGNCYLLAGGNGNFKSQENISEGERKKARERMNKLNWASVIFSRTLPVPVRRFKDLLFTGYCLKHTGVTTVNRRPCDFIDLARRQNE